jgi:hypothetical protein
MGGGGYQEVGDGAYGDVTFNAGVSDFSTVSINGGSRYASVVRKVNNVSADGRTITLATTAGGTNYLDVGDEVMLIVTAASSTADCVSSGNELHAGYCNFYNATATDGATSVTIDSALVNNASTD